MTHPKSLRVFHLKNEIKTVTLAQSFCPALWHSHSVPRFGTVILSRALAQSFCPALWNTHSVSRFGTLILSRALAQSFCPALWHSHSVPRFGTVILSRALAQSFCPALNKFRLFKREGSLRSRHSIKPARVIWSCARERNQSREEGVACLTRVLAEQVSACYEG